MELRVELRQLELIELPLNAEWGNSDLGMRQYVSLGALLSHALATWLSQNGLAVFSGDGDTRMFQLTVQPDSPFV